MNGEPSATTKLPPLARGLGCEDKTATKLLKRILYWTGGHPYLTQRLSQVVAADAQINDIGGIDRLCDALFFTTRVRERRERDDNLLFVRERLLKREADGHEGTICDVAWATDGKSFAAADEKHVIVVRDAITGKELATMKIPSVPDAKDDPTLSIAFSPDGQRIVAVDEKNSVSVFDVRQKKLIHAFQTQGLAAPFMPDASKVALEGKEKD